MKQYVKRVTTVVLSILSFLAVVSVSEASAARVCEIRRPCEVTLEILEAWGDTRSRALSGAYEVYGGGAYKCVPRTGASPSHANIPVTTYSTIRSGQAFVAGQAYAGCNGIDNNTHICEFSVPSSPYLAAMRVRLYKHSCSVQQIYH